MIDFRTLFEGDTEFGHYQVANCIYGGRPARVLYSGNHQAAQSGVALDDKPELLFDYNERFMELARGLLPKRLLLIGGGAMTLPIALLEELPDLMIDVVELDPGLLDIAERFFKFQPNKQTNVHLGDGRKFLDKTNKRYDLIVVDAFEHTVIPASLQTDEAARQLKRHLTAKGVVAINIIAAYHGERSNNLRQQIAALQTAFQNVEIYPAGSGISLWTPQNFILTAQNGARDLDAHLRYSKLPYQAIDNGAPDRIRTYDLWLRKPTLYPAELHAHIKLNVKVQSAA
jgi:spermidine synthase